MSSEIIKYRWDNEEAAKLQFPKFQHEFIAQLSSQGIAYTLSEATSAMYRPIEPGPEPAEAEDRREWNKSKVIYHQERAKFMKDFDKALGYMRASFEYATKASADLETALIAPDNVQPQDWTPELQFRAAYNKICTAYAPSSSTDVNTLKRELQALNDDGGFYSYAAEFTRIKLQLSKVQACPTAGELRDMVRKGIRNADIRKVIQRLFPFNALPEELPSQERIFEEIRGYLSFLDDIDPYKLINTSPNGKPVTQQALNTGLKPNKHPVRCTKCWRANHKYDVCKQDTCSQCNYRFKDTDLFCPHYKTHQERGTDWAPNHLIKQSSSTPSTPQGGAIPNPQVTPSPPDAVKAARKALKVAIRESKRLKTDNKH